MRENLSIKVFSLSFLLIFLSFSVSLAQTSYDEAPALTERVQAGELPAVEKRLPEQPLVVEPVEEIGQYGGELYTVTQSLGGFGNDLHFIGFEPPLTLKPDGSVAPNVVKSWDVNEDSTVWTLHFREGIKWSDGEPFTAEDVMFWWEDEVQNPKITDTVYISAFKNMKVEKLDDYTVRMTLDKPRPMFKYTLAKQWAYLGKWWRPKHYLKQFNPNYADEEKLKEMAEEQGYDTISNLYQEKAGWGPKQMNPECPTLTAYRLVEKATDHWSWERNPYYWKVDPEGNQLPYVNRVLVRKAGNVEAINTQIASGELDLAVWNTSVENFPLYKSNESKGGYRVLLWQDTRGAEVMFMPNLTVQDEVLREIFQDVRFRRALSLALNRGEINKVIYFSRATPRQFTLHPSSKFFEEEWAEAYADYDPERAKELLDEMGLENTDGDKWRERPDGEDLAFTIEYWPGEVASKTPICELAKEYWAEIGIKVALKPQDRSLNGQRAAANEIQMNLWHGGGVTDSQWQISAHPPLPCCDCITWGSEYACWWDSEGESGIEPSEDVKELFQAADQFVTTVDEEKRMELGKKMWQMQAEKVWYIGTVGMAPKPIIVSENLRNVPQSGSWGSDLLWLHPYNTEQFFFKE